MTTLASHRAYGFLAAVNSIPFRVAYRTFREEFGRPNRAALVAMFCGWHEGRECCRNVMSRAA